MRIALFVGGVLITLVLTFCSGNDSPDNDNSDVAEFTSIADSVVLSAIKAHGGEHYDKAHYAFDFRGMTYTFKNEGDQFDYTRTQQSDGNVVKDVYRNTGLKRFVDDVEQELSEEEVEKYSASVNSVIYFATLPHKLKDESVNKKYLGNTTIKGKVYDGVKVTFDQQGGGTDYQDEYCYWFDIHTHYLDYLAYNFQENGEEGVRFRAAFNQREVDEIRFQDYVNYKADPSVPLEELPGLYEKDKLELVSIIATENVKNLNR